MVNPQDISQALPQDANGPARQQLSALMDGELDPADWAASCDAVRHDAGLRAEWHDWHLIGDAMRSIELAAGASRDCAFLNTFRARLAAEPVVLAPVAPAMALPAMALAAAPAARRRLHWAVAPAAMAAGFVAVAGVLVVLRSMPGADAPSTMAAADSRAADRAARGDVQPVSVQMMRDARLDRYLGAHRRIGGAAAAQPYLEGGAVRPVDAVMVAPK